MQTKAELSHLGLGLGLENALIILNLEALENRRIELSRRFANNGIMSRTLNDLFPLNSKKHKVNNRNEKNKR